MKLLKIGCTASCALFLNLAFTIAQPYDFDSLYNHSESFKKAYKASIESYDLFNRDKVMKVTIESDFKNLVKRKYKDEYQPAIFRYYFRDTLIIKRNITIKPRGNMRRSSCFFPPIKLNFKKKEMIVKEMKEFDKMKMVLDCKKGKTYEQYLLSEYYVYKVLNMLTDYSFRVRLVHVTYVDTSEKYKTSTRYAFIIESKEQLADRVDCIPIDTKNVNDRYTDIPALVNTYLFQFMIGNTDWSIPGRHNIQMIKSTDPTNQKPYVIPYDFDYSGMVNTSYAVPDENLGTESVRERVYRGVCLPESMIKEGINAFIEKKKDIYNLYDSSSLLDKNNKMNSIKYLDEFYAIIENERSVKRDIVDTCR